MTKRIIGLILAIAAIAVIVIAAIRHNTYTSMIEPAATEMPAPEKTGQKKPAPEPLRPDSIIRKSKCSTDFKRNDFLKKTKRTHWVRFVHLNSLIESCVFLYLWNSPFDTFL